LGEERPVRLAGWSDGARPTGPVGVSDDIPKTCETIFQTTVPLLFRIKHFRDAISAVFSDTAASGAKQHVDVSPQTP
jgi:hypothetical protein